MNTKVDDFLNKVKKWQEELEQLRNMLLDCGLMEELKWGVPCYTFEQKNVAIIHGFKEYCAINFFKGSLLSDEKGILFAQTENSQATRQMRFNSVREILEQKSTIKAYIFEAIEIEKAGLNISYKKTEEYLVPEEFQQKLNENIALKIAFEALTQGRQRAYLLHFSEPKQSQTRTARVEKYTQRILNGKGFNDCVCGLSKRMPSCDGSHKFISVKEE